MVPPDENVVCWISVSVFEVTNRVWGNVAVAVKTFEGNIIGPGRKLKVVPDL